MSFQQEKIDVDESKSNENLKRGPSSPLWNSDFKNNTAMLNQNINFDQSENSKEEVKESANNIDLRNKKYIKPPTKRSLTNWIIIDADPKVWK